VNAFAWFRSLRGAPQPADGFVIAGLALLVRVAIVGWAAGRFPPTDDGHFYDVVADRIARGLGYTWAWPDGAVTYAAHYPVGYPALIGLAYALFGSRPVVAMMLNAVIGALGVAAVYGLATQTGKRELALLAGLLAALQPSLVFYTPALMTEGITAAILALLAWLSVATRARESRLGIALLGIGAGALVLIRPQALILAPVFGAVAAWGSHWARVRAAAVVSVVAIGVCLPWTLRNCQRLDRCAFVSANGGWNLFIGSAQKATGAWVSIDDLGVPAECRTVFGEAEKDQCFGRAGMRNVRQHPLHFLSLIPAKLRTTFDWSGAPGHYLSASNAGAFGSRAALVLGVIEVLALRLTLLAALFSVGWRSGPRQGARRVLFLLALPWLFGGPWFLMGSAWISYLMLPVLVLLLGRAAWRLPNPVFAAAVVAATALTHAVFFGAGRYGLVCVLLLIPLAVEGFRSGLVSSA
jgi:4-amino-4-deoxy-L-arabinose transferase-like glycosyltransferase